MEPRPSINKKNECLFQLPLDRKNLNSAVFQNSTDVQIWSNSRPGVCKRQGIHDPLHPSQDKELTGKCLFFGRAW